MLISALTCLFRCLFASKSARAIRSSNTSSQTEFNVPSKNTFFAHAVYIISAKYSLTEIALQNNKDICIIIFFN
ncbi:hypothetical protein PUN28_013777 [Cardiocondyla obscurior]|uniref:Secreted protein n=1 Tax=Cardiocondyla obscurior TaxID=286306 RepID=A0AAW2F2W7_9HYME